MSDYINERDERKKRVDLIRNEFIIAGVEGLLNLGECARSLQTDLQNRLGFFGFNVASQDEEELEDSVEALMDMTDDCCLSDENIVDFQLMDKADRAEWVAERFRACADWDGSTIFPTRFRPVENDFGASTS